MKCVVCPKGPPEVALYRVNPKGETGIWACEKHKLGIDKEVKRIVEAIEKRRR